MRGAQRMKLGELPVVNLRLVCFSLEESHVQTRRIRKIARRGGDHSRTDANPAIPERSGDKRSWIHFSGHSDPFIGQRADEEIKQDQIQQPTTRGNNCAGGCCLCCRTFQRPNQLHFMVTLVLSQVGLWLPPVWADVDTRTALL